jgi:hypothetical protein
MKPVYLRILWVSVLLLSFKRVLSQVSYCTPSFSSCGGISITAVKFGTLNNTSACDGYFDYSNSISAPSITAGTFMPITVSFTARAIFYGSGYVRGWIDFNRNGNFDEAESFNIASSDANATQTFLIRIPFDAVAGITRMRLKIENDGFSQIDPCIVRTSGETEDYSVNIIPSSTPKAFFTVYVNQIASGANNGGSWTNALNNLATAFSIVKSNDTIKVAGGSYTPGYYLTSGVNYLGGYPATGNPTDADRNFSKNVTVLTGGQEMFGFQLNDKTVLNGLVFDNLSSFAGFNAAIRLENSSPVITNCIFKNNESRCLYVNGSNPVISNCFLLNNSSTYTNKGLIQVENNSSPKIINCIFNRNIGTSLINVSGSNLKVENCTFLHNHIFLDDNFPQAEIVVTGNASTVVANTIFSDDWFSNFYLYSKLTDSLNVNADNSSVSSVVNSIVSYNQQGTGLLKMVNPKFKDSTNIAGSDGLYYTADDGLQLMNPCSPAMNTGLNTAIESSTDILGRPRIVSTAVDMGAYEAQSNPAAVPTTLYVNAQANGTKDGSSWTNAFADLQTALAYCSDTIKVAAGTYYPAKNFARGFFELQNGRVLLGGYPATGNPGNNLRNPFVNRTILNAKLPDGNTTSANLVQAANVINTAVLDGFVIQGADANGIYVSFQASPIIKNCTFINNLKGAVVDKQSFPLFVNCSFTNSTAIQIDNAAPTIDSCSFIRNSNGALRNVNGSSSVIKNSSFLANTSDAGADIFNDNSSPQISNCISDSAYANLGGSIANVNGSSSSVSKCVFKNSRSAYDVSSFGGACYNKNAKPTFLNCSFVNAKGNGGALYNLNSTVKLESCLGYGNQPTDNNFNTAAGFMTNSGSNVDIIHCNIVKGVGGAWVIAGFNNSVVNIKNSILWENNFNGNTDLYYHTVENTYAPEIYNSSSTTNIINSITRSYGTNGSNGNMVGVNPRFIDINNPAGADGLFGTPDDGLELCNCSPAINKGAATAALATTDITASQRVVNSVADIGAYEYQASLTNGSKTFFVNASATGADNGSSWQNAYRKLEDALKNTCADTIKIMQGIYKPAVKNRDSTFVINRSVLLMGGYELSASPSESKRDPDNFPTILSGEIGNQNDSTDNSFVILNINYTDTTVKLDGLTLSNCYHDHIIDLSVQSGGAIVSQHNKDVVINNCRFTGNHSTPSFSPNSILSRYGRLNISHSVFSKNYSVDGCTAEIQEGVISNSIFTENYASNGNNVVADGSTDFKNCLFYKNFAGAAGAGVLNKGVSTFVNCNFINNTAHANGAGIRNVGRAYLLNCVLSGNYTGNGYYADWYDYTGAPDGGSGYYANPNIFDIVNSVYETFFPYRATLALPGQEQFVNMSDAIGPDKKWFTDDDGLRLLPCSPLIDKGDVNTGIILESRNVAMPATDILDSARITGAGLDVGAYEYPGHFTPTVKIQATDSLICDGSPVSFSAAQTGLGLTPTFQWQLNDVNTGADTSVFTTAVLKNNDRIKVIITGEACAAGTVTTSNTITIKVNAAITPLVSITADNVAVCQGSPATFTATPVNGGPVPFYEWQVDGIKAGSNTASFTSSGLTNNALVKVRLGSSLKCAVPDTVTSNIIKMTVSAVPVANAGNDTAVCAGGTAQLNGSGGDTYLWSPAIGVGNTGIANPTASPANTTTYVLTISNSSHCTATDTVVVSVNQPAAPAVTISTANSTICQGSAIRLTASVTNGGTIPAFQWQVNGINQGPDTNVFTSNAFSSNDQVSVLVTSNATCITTDTVLSNIITIVSVKLDSPFVQLSDQIFTIQNPDPGATYTWQSFTNGHWANAVPSAAGVSFAITAKGEYRVMAVKDPCVIYSPSTIANFRTINAANPYGIFIYPNPVNSSLVVDSIKTSQHWEVADILSSTGQPVAPEINIGGRASVTIDVNGLRPGVYMVRLRKSDGEFTLVKFVKL